MEIKTPLMSTQYLKIVNWAEQFYAQRKRFPPVESFLSYWPGLDVDDFLNHPAVKKSFHNRGMKTAFNRGPQDLSDEQVAAVLTIANYDDRRSIPRKLSSLGIPVTRWNGWKRDQHFREFLHSQLVDNVEGSLDRAFEGLLRAVDKGEVTAIKYYMELTGRAPSEKEQNFKLAVSRIVESLTRHVKDPETIKRIGQDFEMIMAGKDPNVLFLNPVEDETGLAI